MATSVFSKQCFIRLSKLTRGAHTSSSSAKAGKNNPFLPKKSTIPSNAATTKRSLQSIAHVKDAKHRHRSAISDPIVVGSRNISTDPCLSTVTLGELREAKHQSQKIQEKLFRWIWEGESWAVFAENNIQITKVKLLPTFDRLKIYWSATGAEFMDRVIQETLDREVLTEIEDRMKSQDFQGRPIPQIEFVADMSQIYASELADGHHLQHPTKPSGNSKLNQNELLNMRILTGITSLKLLEPTTSNETDANCYSLEADQIERSEIQGLDYHAILNEILTNPSSNRF